MTFDGTGSSDADEPTYRWNFGDGQQATGAIVTHVYAKAGKHVVTLSVRDGNGGVDLAQERLVVRGAQG